MMTVPGVVEADVSSKGRPFRSYRIEGFEILVGKGDRDNDHLTFEVAEPGDLWLHVAGPAGSHVLVRNPDGLDDIPREVVEGAARLAAWHSKARGSRGKVEVHVCRAGDVRKRRGSPPGKVEIRNWTAVRVYAKEPSIVQDGGPSGSGSW